MKILTNAGGIAYTNAYVVADEAAGVAVLFDAPNDTAAPLLDQVEANGWDLIGLWLTHGHFDHLADHQLVRDRFPRAQILIHPLDEPKLKTPVSRLFPLPFVIPPGHADGLLEDGQELQLGGMTARVIFTPGHSPGHVMFYFEAQKVLVGGDLIIGGAVGRTDLPDSSEADLIASVRRVMQLPGETQLLPGHGQPGTLDYERRTNQYVREMLKL